MYVTKTTGSEKHFLALEVRNVKIPQEASPLLNTAEISHYSDWDIPSKMNWVMTHGGK